MQFFKQVDLSTIEFGVLTHRGERSSSIYTTTLLTDSFTSWLEFKISLSIDGLIFEIEIFGQIIGFEVLSVIEDLCDYDDIIDYDEEF
jgi:hypothetical protein